jgi:hypothetical protein
LKPHRRHWPVLATLARTREPASISSRHELSRVSNTPWRRNESAGQRLHLHRPCRVRRRAAPPGHTRRLSGTLPPTENVRDRRHQQH